MLNDFFEFLQQEFRQSIFGLNLTHQYPNNGEASGSSFNFHQTADFFLKKDSSLGQGGTRKRNHLVCQNCKKLRSSFGLGKFLIYDLMIQAKESDENSVKLAAIYKDRAVNMKKLHRCRSTAGYR